MYFSWDEVASIVQLLVGCGACAFLGYAGDQGSANAATAGGAMFAGLMVLEITKRRRWDKSQPDADEEPSASAAALANAEKKLLS